MSKLAKALLPGAVVTAAALAVWVLFVAGTVIVYLMFQFGGSRLPSDAPVLESVVIYLVVALGVGFGGFLWFIPATIAAFRECRSYWGILILNLVPGLGHLVALVWSLVEQPPTPVIVQHFHSGKEPSQPS